MKGKPAGTSKGTVNPVKPLFFLSLYLFRSLSLSRGLSVSLSLSVSPLSVVLAKGLGLGLYAGWGYWDAGRRVSGQGRRMYEF